MLTDPRCGAHAVGLIDIRGEGGGEVHRVRLRQLQSETGSQVAQRPDVRGEVIRHVGGEFVDQADLLKAGGVIFRLDLHLQVVLQVEADLPSHTRSGRLVDVNAVRRILHERHVAVGVGLLIGLAVAIALVAEVRCITEADTRREDVADGLDLVAEEFAAGGIEAVELRIDIQRDIPVIDVVEARHRVGHLLLILRVPVLLSPPEEHAVCEIETGGDIHIAQSR